MLIMKLSNLVLSKMLNNGIPISIILIHLLLKDLSAMEPVIMEESNNYLVLNKKPLELAKRLNGQNN
jgi:hypothetical protein